MIGDTWPINFGRKKDTSGRGGGEKKTKVTTCMCMGQMTIRSIQRLSTRTYQKVIEALYPIGRPAIHVREASTAFEEMENTTKSKETGFGFYHNFSCFIFGNDKRLNQSIPERREGSRGVQARA
jgi:hypothetical protein